MKQLCQNKHTIRFRYWSRKKYAMFYSLGKYEEGMAPVESMLQMLRIQLPQPQVADVICLFYLNKYLFAGKMCHASFRLFLS